MALARLCTLRRIVFIQKPVRSVLQGVTNLQEYNDFLNEHPNVFQYMSGQFFSVIDAQLLNFLRGGKFLAQNLSDASVSPVSTLLCAVSSNLTFPDLLLLSLQSCTILHCSTCAGRALVQLCRC
jgi:hypothetical protein